VDNFPVRRKNPGPCGTSHSSWVKFKTAENKGVWEFESLELAARGRTSCRTMEADAARTSRELQESGGVLTPPIVKAIP